MNLRTLFYSAIIKLRLNYRRRSVEIGDDKITEKENYRTGIAFHFGCCNYLQM